MKNELQNIVNPSAAGLNILVAYDDLVSGIEAMELCDTLAQQFKPSYPLTFSFWSLSALGIPLLARAASEEAAKMNLLIVAANGDANFPAAIKSWISRSARRLRYHGGAFVALLHGILPMHEEICPAYECLKHIADDTGVNFFSEVTQPVAEEMDRLPQAVGKDARLAMPAWDTVLELI